MNADSRRKSSHSGARQFLKQDDGVKEVCRCSAILFRIIDAEEPQISHPVPDRPGNTFILLPFLCVWGYLLFNELPHHTPEYFVIRGEIQRFHKHSLFL